MFRSVRGTQQGWRLTLAIFLNQPHKPYYIAKHCFTNATACRHLANEHGRMFVYIKFNKINKSAINKIFEFAKENIKTKVFKSYNRQAVVCKVTHIHSIWFTDYYHLFYGLIQSALG